MLMLHLSSAAPDPVPKPVPVPPAEVPEDKPHGAPKATLPWQKYGTPILVLLLAIAIVVTITRNWNSWEGGKIEQDTERLSALRWTWQMLRNSTRKDCCSNHSWTIPKQMMRSFTL